MMPPRAAFDILARVSPKKRSKEGRPIFDAIRKPTAPPSRKFGKAKPEEKARPALRKIKHKDKAAGTERDGDL